jgi:hypothetical protein
MKIKLQSNKKPKQPKTAYLFYYFEKKIQIKKIYPYKTNQEIQKLIGQEFKNLPESKKKKYFKLAEKDKKSYVIRMKKWEKKAKKNNENKENNKNTEKEKNESKNEEEKKNNENENNQNEKNENKNEEEKKNNENESNQNENNENIKDEEKNNNEKENNEKENNENIKECNDNKSNQNFSAPNPVKKDKNSLSNEDYNFVSYSKFRRNILSKTFPLISQSDITEIIKDEWEHLSENERNKKN